MPKTNIIIDFDSTFVSEEGLENLARISLKDDPAKDAIINEIQTITDLGMAGRITFTESLKKRIALLKASQSHVEELAEYFKAKVSPSIRKSKDLIRQNARRIYIFTGGFREFIMPALEPFNIPEPNIFANTFKYDGSGNIIGFDEANPLAKPQGKVAVLAALKLGPDTVVVGDGYTDYEMKAAGLARKFIVYTENACRINVAKVADEIAPSFDIILKELLP